MPDREKVIKEFELFIKEFHPACTSEGVELDMFREVLALLKEQEAVEPRVSTAEQRCGHCNKVIEMDGWQSCPWCGKRIDWKGWWNKNGTHDNA